MTEQPTLRPWRVVSDSYNVTPGHGWAIADGDACNYLATNASYTNATHIVRCVNAYDELVAALEAVDAGVWATPESGVASYQVCLSISAMDRARAALAKARGEAVPS